MIAAVVLAAGQSRRMGEANKLLADIDGAPMIARVVDAIQAAGVAPIVVVTGHDAARVRAALAPVCKRSDRPAAAVATRSPPSVLGLRPAGAAGAPPRRAPPPGCARFGKPTLGPVCFVHNPAYEQGMSTSLRAGVGALGAAVQAALVCLGDMPRVTPAHIAALVAAFDPAQGREICVPWSQGRRGNPVLFGARFFAEMGRLRGDVGARALIEAHADVVHPVPVDDGGVLVDVDTPVALAALRGVRPGGA